MVGRILSDNKGQPQARTTGRRSKQHCRMQVTSIANNYRSVKVGVGVKKEKRRGKEQAKEEGGCVVSRPEQVT